MRGNSHVRCEVGEKLEITSKTYLSPYKSVELELELENKGKKELLEIVQNISNMINIHYIRQKEPRGLGDAIYTCKTYIKYVKKKQKHFDMLLTVQKALSEMRLLQYFLEMT